MIDIIANASGLLAFLSGYSCLMGPIAAIMICDYYVIKKSKLVLPDMYNTHGIYYYTKGFNWQAFTAFFLGVTPLMPGFAKSIDHNIDVGGVWKVYTFAWLFGFATSFGTYYLICTYVKDLGDAIVGDAVYPAQLGEGSDEEKGVIEAIDGEGTHEKRDTAIGVNEVGEKDSKV